MGRGRLNLVVLTYLIEHCWGSDLCGFLLHQIRTYAEFVWHFLGMYVYLYWRFVVEASFSAIARVVQNNLGDVILHAEAACIYMQFVNE